MCTVPLLVINYVVEVQTGDLPGADTEANVYIQLIGTWSDSGKRTLHRSNQDIPFEPGQVKKSVITITDAA